MRPRHAATPSPIMTVVEVAHYLQVSRNTLYKLIRQRQIPVFKMGSDYRFDGDAIEKWMADRQAKG